MIKLESVSKVFQQNDLCVEALKDVNLTVPEGAIVGVIGTSGAGKSTLIRCVNGLESVSSGSVVVDGVDISQAKGAALREARSSIGMIFQHFNLLSTRTVFDNIALPLEFKGATKDEIEAAVAPLLELTGLSAKRDQYPAELSGGQKQHVAIARALAAKPKVLLCDEATSALDPKTTQSILTLLKDINTRMGLTILLITHEMDVVKSICDRVAVISGGEIVEENDVQSFFVQPKSDLARSFVKTALHENLPPELDSRISSVSQGGDHPVVRLSFLGGSTSLPLISEVSRQHNVDISILQSSIEQLKGQSMGFLTAEIKGHDAAISEAILRLKQEPMVTLEVLGYVV